MLNSSAINWFIALLGFLLLGLLMTDTPELFRLPKLRFLYRTGVLIYRRTSNVAISANSPVVHRWQIEHWMTTSSCFFPLAVEDTPGKFLLMEFMGTRLYRVPALLRGAIRPDPLGSLISVSAYLTWTHTFILLFLIALPIIGISTSPQLPVWCGSLPLAAYSLAAAALFRRQTKMFSNVGDRMASYLSQDSGTNQPAA